MIMRELPNAPSTEVTIVKPELTGHNRWNAGYFQERFRQACLRNAQFLQWPS
jgi:hypothetical protein